MEAYGLGYWEVMRTPIRAFWMLSRNVDRLRAERALHHFQVAVVAANPEAESVKGLQAELRAQMGEVARQAEVLDRQGLRALKDLQFGV